MVRNQTKICSIRNGLGRKSGVSQQEGGKKKRKTGVKSECTTTKMMTGNLQKKVTPGSLVCCEYIVGVMTKYEAYYKTYMRLLYTCM